MPGFVGRLAMKMRDAVLNVVTRVCRTKPSIALFLVCLAVLLGWYSVPKEVVHTDLPFSHAYYVGLGIRPENTWYGRRFFKIIHEYNDEIHAVVEIRQSGLCPYTCYKNGQEYRRGWCSVEYGSDLWQNDVLELAKVPIAMLDHEHFGLPMKNAGKQNAGDTE